MNLKRKTAIVAAIAAITFATMLAAGRARADGLLYQLPQDGSWAKYDLEITGTDPGGGEMKMSGSLTMSSVGKADASGEPCRWIEIKMQMRDPSGNDQTIVAKALIPEKNLKRGENGWASMKKAWIKQPHNEEPEQITEANGDQAGPLPAFLSGPLNESKDLEGIEIESGIGKLQCAGVSGHLTINDGNSDVAIQMENRLHEMAPFGVVASTMSFEVKRDGEVREKGTIKFKLAEVGQDAKSELPDAN
jgi:hypothetical protein